MTTIWRPVRIQFEPMFRINVYRIPLIVAAKVSKLDPFPSSTPGDSLESLAENAGFPPT